jgi:hypothetical protein
MNGHAIFSLRYVRYYVTGSYIVISIFSWPFFCSLGNIAKALHLWEMAVLLTASHLAKSLHER